ncbi:hypothetical protein ILUMI_08744 [Ignelater luminosus]|uniref:Transposase n=1 Tax=Ignelater luminosus TaxID=2038154 RepID=A0A8K0GGQ5_IGNLU|nr:hypothetical protein ILUMI_08744 [Ignelater luminosus]
MRWNSEERAFAVEAYFSSGCSTAIVTWVTTFRQTASATKRRTGVPRPVRSPENIEAVRASMLRSPRRSARKHASALRLSDRSVRRILRDDLHFHPYKMAIVQELSEQDGARHPRHGFPNEVKGGPPQFLKKVKALQQSIADDLTFPS